MFGRVIEGMDVVDKIASVNTNNENQPVDPGQARIESVSVG